MHDLLVLQGLILNTFKKKIEGRKKLIDINTVVNIQAKDININHNKDKTVIR